MPTPSSETASLREIVWTDVRVEELEALWKEGLSATEISAKLHCGVTRNAVLGKVHRMGLLRERHLHPAAGAPIRRRKPRQKVNPRGPYAVAVHPMPSPEIVPDEPQSMTDQDIPFAQRRSVFQLTDETCRWPIGDPGTPDFFFCGAQTNPNKPYCSDHCARAYNGVPPRLPRAFREYWRAA